MSVPFIAIEGPIGAGKTTLAKAIAEANGFYQLQEIVDENPFLNKFYDNIDEWSFQTEMFFLCNRYKQLRDLHQVLQEERPVVADYHIFKNLLFAKRTLQSEEYVKYEAIYEILTKDMPMPTMIIYLHANLETLLDRITLRGRSFEQNMEPSYLEQLSADYKQFMKQFEAEHPHIPVLHFDGDTLDFVQREADLHYILEAVSMALKKEN